MVKFSLNFICSFNVARLLGPKGRKNEDRVATIGLTL
jgi:hypothetical protein